MSALNRHVYLSTNNLSIGMFVCALDRPWLETPFPLEGVLLKSLREIETIRLYCDSVFVDPDKSWVRVTKDGVEESKQFDWSEFARKRRSGILAKLMGGRDKSEGSEDGTSLDDEMPAAKKVYSDSSMLVAAIMADIRNNRSFDIDNLHSVCNDMVDSVLRNHNALLWLSQLRNYDDYSYQHAINVCILSLSLGKHLDFPGPKLRQLATAGMLQDIGLLRLPSEILRKQGPLTEVEQRLAKSHVQKSIDMLREQRALQPEIERIILEHHERFDGSGYPLGLKGHSVSVEAAITGISDCFDAMLSERPYSSKMSSFDALMVMYELRGKTFNPALIERFIQCIGVYPIGSLVELNQGEVAIVVEQRRSNKLKPRLLQILDGAKNYLTEPLSIDLLTNPQRKSGEPYMIKEVLPSNAYDIDPTEYFLT